MPKMLVDCVDTQKAQGTSEDAAWQICVGRFGPKGLGYIEFDKAVGDWVLTEKGKNAGNGA
jgi:hypothetical protein